MARRRRGDRPIGRARSGEELLTAVLSCAAVVPPLLLGGGPAWALLLITVIGASVAGVFLWRVGPPRGSHLLLLGGTAGLACTAAQLVPLPERALRFFSPHGVEPTSLDQLRSAAALLGGTAPTWAPITASVAGTHESLIIGGALLAFTLAGTLAVADGRRRALVVAIACSSLAMAAVIALHVLLGLEDVYGIVEPVEPLVLVSPLFNENHAAAFLALGVPCCLGLALGTHTRSAAVGWFVSAGLLASGCIACVSRGGLIGLVVGLGAFAVLRVASNRKQGPKRIALSPVVAAGLGVLLLAVGLTVYAGLEALSYDLRTTTLNKLRFIAYGLDLVARAPWVGIGRGAYSTALVHLTGSDVRFEYAECFPVQWAAEWGLPFTLGLLGLLSVAVSRAVRSELSAERVGALAALAGLGAHELVDFSTELLGVGCVATLLACAALTDRSTAPQLGAPSWLGRAAHGIPVLAVLLVVVPGAGIAPARVNELRDELTVTIERGDGAAIDRQLALAVATHPGEPSFALLGAYAHARRGDPSTPRWLNAAMTLAPRWYSTHLVAAEWLAYSGNGAQAWLEVREAERCQPGHGSSVACRLLVATPDDIEEGVRVMADEPGGVAFLDGVLDGCVLPAPSADALARELLTRGAPRATRRAAAAELRAGHPDAALALLEPFDEDDDPWVALVRVEALLAASRAADAVAVATDARAPGLPPRERLERLARAQVAAGDADGMRATIQRLEGEAAGDPGTVASALILLGDLEAQLGNRSLSAVAFDRADTIAPASGALAHAIQVADSLGETHRAGDLRARLCARAPSTPGC